MSRGGSNYFGALMRSAGQPSRAAAPSTRSTALPAAPQALDPFEAAEAAETSAETAPLMRSDAPPAIASHQTPARPQPSTSTALPAASPSAQPPQLANDAQQHPAIQAALRWIAQGPDAGMGTKPITPNVDGIAAHLPTAPRLPPLAVAPKPPTAAPVAPHVDDARNRTDRPGSETPRESARQDNQYGAARDADAPAAPRHRALSLTATPSPGRPNPPQATEASSSGSNNSNRRTEVHIGTLHVTLDAPTVARFTAARTVAPPAPEPARASAAGNSRSSSRQSAGSGGSPSGLSRSRLPRW